MREIKFRYVLKVYNTSRDDPAYYEWLELKVFTLSELENNGLNEWILKEFNGVIETIAKNQYTGLKDKNGKEIYEGDIVEVEFLYYPESDKEKLITKYISTITFQAGCFEFYDGYEYHVPCQPCFRIRIIGNIYENPGLLKE